MTSSCLDTAHRDRVLRSLAFRRPDRTPRDFAAAPEVWDRLAARFDVSDRDAILRRLGVDCRIVSYDAFCRRGDLADHAPAGAAWRHDEPDGSTRDLWGAHRACGAAAVGSVEHFVSYPLGAADRLDELQAYPWPEPAAWDFRDLGARIDALQRDAAYHIRYRAGSVFETAWSLVGFERFLTDLATGAAASRYLLDRVADILVEALRRALSAAGDRIDLVYFYDDLATQDGLLISPRLYERCVQPHHQRLIDAARSFGKPAMLHCCGAIRPMIPRFIDMGLAVLNPVQPSARGMDPESLARDFGGRITFHGGIDIQRFLPAATPARVRAEARRVSEILGRDGGFILAPSHHVLPDTPIENILALYGVAWEGASAPED